MNKFPQFAIFFPSEMRNAESKVFKVFIDFKNSINMVSHLLCTCFTFTHTHKCIRAWSDMATTWHCREDFSILGAKINQKPEASQFGRPPTTQASKAILLATISSDLWIHWEGIAEARRQKRAYPERDGIKLEKQLSKVFPPTSSFDADLLRALHRREFLSSFALL